MAVAFDTLRYAETLHSSGLPEEQAKAQAKALSNALKEGNRTRLLVFFSVRFVAKGLHIVKHAV